MGTGRFAARARRLAWRAALIIALSAIGLGLSLQGDAQSPEVLQAAPQSTSDWPQLQFDAQRSGHNPQPFNPTSFTLRWQRNIGAPMAGRIQPVIGGGVAIVGDLNGKVHALSVGNGNPAWTYQTGAAILYTAAISQSRVFVGSHDGYLYALDLSTGAKLWQTPVPKGIGGAPLVWGDRVYVGGKNGYFYAFEAASGAEAWRFDTAATPSPSVRAPILSSPALHPAQNLIFFAAENLKAYALNLNGTLRWTFQMYGESAYDSWPVVSLRDNVVMFRTKSAYSFYSSLGLDDAELFCPGQSGTGCGSCASLDPTLFNSPSTTVSPGSAQWNEQHLDDGDSRVESIDELFNAYPQRLTFYALDVDTGQHKLGRPAPVLWTGGGGRLGIMPVVNQSNGNVYTFWRTKWSRRDAIYFCRKWVDLGRLSFAESRPTLHFLPCPSGSGNQCDSFDFHFIGDETTVLSLAGDWLFMTGWYNTGAMHVVNGGSFNLSGGEGSGGSGDSAVPASIAGNMVYVKKASGGESRPIDTVVAYQSQ